MYQDAIFKAFSPLYTLLIGFTIATLGFTKLVIYIKYLIRKHSQSPDWKAFAEMTGIEFEKSLRQLFEKHGWSVQLTPRSGDFGADLLLRREGKFVVVQAKRWKKPIGLKAVQEVAAARDFYKANEAWVVTTSTFTEAAIKQAKASKVRLKNQNSLTKLLSIDTKESIKKSGVLLQDRNLK